MQYVPQQQAAQPYAQPQRSPAVDDESVYDSTRIELRNLVVDRLLRMNARHAMWAWEVKARKPLGPHALAFLYQDMEESEGGHKRQVVRAGTRLFYDGDDVRDLWQLLDRLTKLARTRYIPDPRGFDPLKTMVTDAEPMSWNAKYLGLGISTLDTNERSWQQTQAVASGPLETPGRCFAVLVDGSLLALDRVVRDDSDGRKYLVNKIRSTHPLDIGMPSRAWSWQRDLGREAGTELLWVYLSQLHEAVVEGLRPRPGAVFQQRR